jgi:predicted Rossmann fold nucleotide-binding protein DprA/Smf involved in DNA uptake
LITGEKEDSETMQGDPASIRMSTKSGLGDPAVHGEGGKVARAVLNALQPDVARKLDSLMESLEGVSPSEILTALFELEMAGLIRQLAGKNYVRVWND